MRSHVEFRSAKFPACDDENEKVNPGRWGRRLAEYLYEKLQERGFAVDDIHAEDWGWGIRFAPGAFPFPMWIGCGNCDEHPDKHLVFIEPSKPVIRKFFRRIDTTVDVGRVADALDKILTSDPDIHTLRWWSDDER